MSKSRKKTPIGTYYCPSQKRGKQFCNRKFRHRERILLCKDRPLDLPLRTREVTNPWDLGGDGKTFWGFHPKEDWYQKFMRK
ncbi:MAG: hypothetical protein IJK87_15575 [Prevotella sp.]|nr:hypothetical protein [Prevotella sp.]